MADYCFLQTYNNDLNGNPESESATMILMIVLCPYPAFMCLDNLSTKIQPNARAII